MILPDCVPYTNMLRDETLLGKAPGVGPDLKACNGHGDFCPVVLQAECVDCELSSCKSTMEACRGCGEYVCVGCYDKDFLCEHCRVDK